MWLKPMIMQYTGIIPHLFMHFKQLEGKGDQQHSLLRDLSDEPNWDIFLGILAREDGGHALKYVDKTSQSMTHCVCVCTVEMVFMRMVNGCFNLKQ